MFIRGNKGEEGDHGKPGKGREKIEDLLEIQRKSAGNAWESR